MQRIHFTATDLARTRLRSTLGPVAEGLFALGALNRVGGPGYVRWRNQVLGQTGQLMPGAARLTASLRRLEAPDRLLCLVDSCPGADDSGLRALGISREQTRTMVLEVWRTAVAPYWDRILGHLTAECDARGRIAMTGGVERLLATLHPRIVWAAPVLEIHDGPDRDVWLKGQGLLLNPSVFLPGRVGRVIARERETGQSALVFAAPGNAHQVAGLWDAQDDSVQALSALVGQTRAAALRALTATCTTGQLAARLGISCAGASQHAAVLRKSGLITTRRMRNNVLHTVTPLGMALLGGRLRDPVPAAEPRSRSAAS